jgi:hypothetical protein
MMHSTKEPKKSNSSGEILKDFNKNLKTTRIISKSIEMLSDFYFLDLPNKVIENEISDTKLFNLINHLKKNDILLFSDITKDFIIQFSKTSGVGVNKIVQLLSMIENLENENQNSNELELLEYGNYSSKKIIEVKFCELYYDPKYIQLRNHYLSFDLREGNFNIAFLNIMADVISKYKK